MSYHHRTMDEQDVIYRMRWQGCTQAEIARCLDRYRSTIRMRIAVAVSASPIMARKCNTSFSKRVPMHLHSFSQPADTALDDIRRYLRILDSSGGTLQGRFGKVFGAGGVWDIVRCREYLQPGGMVF